MSFKDSLSLRCFKSVCLWSFILILAVIAVFFCGYIINILISFLIFQLIYHDINLGQGLGWLTIVIPTILVMFISIILFAVANGYLGFIFYLEYIKKEQNIPIGIVDKTEHIFNKLIKNDLYKKLAFILLIFLYIFSFFILVANFYAIFIGLIFFIILLIKYKLKK